MKGKILLVAFQSAILFFYRRFAADLIYLSQR
jgi:hypothetical protein